MKKIINLSTLLIIIILPISIESQKKKYTFVGVKVCKKCHISDSIGGQYKLWSSSLHSKAYQDLTGSSAYEIAKKSGINSPEKNENCLKCHNTGKGKVKISIGEGVGCEACHGPASGYYEFSIHAANATKKNNYNKAKKYGMYPILGDDNIKSREKLCKHCHNHKRQCYNATTLKKKKLTELPLSIIADFKHEIR